VWSEEEKKSRGAQELGQIEEKMLIPRMKAVSCKIARREIVFEIVEWCDCWMREEVGPGDRVVGIESRVRVDRDKGSKESREDGGNKCEGSIEDLLADS